MLQTRFKPDLTVGQNTAQINSSKVGGEKSYFLPVFQALISYTTSKLVNNRGQGLPSSPGAGWHRACQSSFPPQGQGPKCWLEHPGPPLVTCTHSAKDAASPTAATAERKKQRVPRTGEIWQNFLVKLENLPTARLYSHKSSSFLRGAQYNCRAGLPSVPAPHAAGSAACRDAGPRTLALTLHPGVRG